MADSTRRGAKGRHPARTPARSETAPARPERETRYLDIGASGYVDTTRPTPPAVRTPEPVMTRRQFEAEYQRLLREFGDSMENPGSFRCEGCRNCANCMFCQDCEGSYRCTHCTRCRDSSQLTHCQDCVNCHGSSYCLQCQNCVGSSYLVLCRSCSDCTYCFGCVGLSKKDFHIHNVKYSKTEYFRMVKALRAELGL